MCNAADAIGRIVTDTVAVPGGFSPPASRYCYRKCLTLGITSAVTSAVTVPARAGMGHLWAQAQQAQLELCCRVVAVVEEVAKEVHCRRQLCSTEWRSCPLLKQEGGWVR